MTARGPGARRSRRRVAGRLAGFVLAAGALAGCAIPFGDSGSGPGTLREQNSRFLQEQELRAKERSQGSDSFGVPDRP